jgi:hypothetical protein
MNKINKNYDGNIILVTLLCLKFTYPKLTAQIHRSVVTMHSRYKQNRCWQTPYILILRPPSHLDTILLNFRHKLDKDNYPLPKKIKQFPMQLLFFHLGMS